MLGRRRVVRMWRRRRIARIMGVRRGHHRTRHTCEGEHMSPEILYHFSRGTYHEGA